MLQEFRKWRRQLGTLVLVFFVFPMFSMAFSADTSFKDTYMPWSGRTITGVTSFTATTVSGTTGSFTNLTGHVIGTDVQAYDDNLNDIAGFSASPADSNIMVGNGSALVLESGATLRTSIGVAIGTDVQAYDDNLADIAGFSATPTDSNIMVGDGSDFVLESGTTLRTSIGVAIGSDVQGYDADLAALGGLTSAADKLPYFTGSGTAGVTDLSSFSRTYLDDADEATLKATLNLEAGTDFNAYDSDLASISGLSNVDGYHIRMSGSGYETLTTASLVTNLGLVIGTNTQAWDDDLDDLAALTPTDGLFIVGNGTDFITENGATARTSLGLGDVATQNKASIDITGGTVAGVAITNSSFSGTVNQSALIKTGSYTASAGEIVGVVSTGGAFRVTFPTNPTAGDMIRITDLGLALETNAVVLDAGEATDHMNGTTQSLSLDWNGLDLRCIATSVSAWSCSGT